MFILLNVIASKLEKCKSVESACLFGSRARGDFKERSDFDICIFGDVSAKDRLTILNYIDNDLPTLLKIDLVFFNELNNIEFKNNITNEGVVFYDKNRKQEEQF